MSAAGDRFDIRLNGQSRSLARGTTVEDLVCELGREPSAVAVECRGEIVPRERYAEVELVEGDHLEIVHFVQGG